MIAVGLTGGIASGKSFIIKYLKKLKIPTHEKDSKEKELKKKKNKEKIRKISSQKSFKR